MENVQDDSLGAASFVELTVRSNFSFLQAGSPPEALVRRAVELGYDAMAITDRDGLYGVVRAMEEADRLGLRLIVGSEVTFLRRPDFCPESREACATLTVLIENLAGYGNLCRILTASHGAH